MTFAKILSKERLRVWSLLSTHFKFRLDGLIRRVIVDKKQNVLDEEILARVRHHIIQKYSALYDRFTITKTKSYTKVINFIRNYEEFCKYVSGVSGQGRFVISNIMYEQEIGIMGHRSWLIENLRYMFPRKFGLTLKDSLLSHFLFGPTPDGQRSTITEELSKASAFNRFDPASLLAIDYRINKLTVESFNAKGIKISKDGLKTLQKSVSYLIYYYIFGGYQDLSYVSKTTRGGWEVGREFWTLEYEVIRAVFFAAAEANNGNPLSIKTISKDAGFGLELGSYLTTGITFIDSINKLISYCDKLAENRPRDSDPQIFRSTSTLLDSYYNAYKERHRGFVKSKKFPSLFQGLVHGHIESLLGIKFTSEVSLKSVVKEKFIIDQGTKEKIYVGRLILDGYHELSKSLKKYLGLDDKWIGIAFEAQSGYWHDKPVQIERDRRKRLVCEAKNILLLEVWYQWDKSTWGANILGQIEAKTGVKIPLSKIGGLAKFLGNNLDE